MARPEKERLKRAFFSLLRRGLWENKELKINKLALSLDASEWEDLFLMATHHTVEGLFFQSFESLEARSWPPENLLIRWAIRVEQIEKRNLRMNAFIGMQAAWFKHHGLSPLLLKGQSVAQAYDKPLQRMSGDVDWYFNAEDYDKAYGLLQRRGQKIDYRRLDDLSYTSNGIIVEHHRDIFDLCNPFKRNIVKRMELEAKNNTQQLQLGEEEVAILSPLQQILQVNIHILKHQLGFGIGFRQICDSARLYHNLRGAYDPEELKYYYNKLGIIRWSHVLHAFLVEYVGLDRDSLPFEVPQGTDCTWMMHEVYQSGTFGYMDERYVNGKFNPLSIQPDSAKRIWKNLTYYGRIVPMESMSYVLKRLLMKPINKQLNS